MAREAKVEARREPIEIRYGIVLAVGLGTAAFLAASMGGLYAYFARNADVAEVLRPARFPEPRVQSDPAGDLRDLQAAHREQQDSYAWVDRERGLVRIPVARAMELLAERGADAWAPLETPEPGVPMPVRPEAARR